MQNYNADLSAQPWHNYETYATTFAGMEPTFTIEELLEGTDNFPSVLTLVQMGHTTEELMGDTNQENTTTTDMQIMEPTFTLEELLEGTTNNQYNNTSSLVQMERTIEELMDDTNQDNTTWTDAMIEPTFTIEELLTDITLDEFLNFYFGKLKESDNC